MSAYELCARCRSRLLASGACPERGCPEHERRREAREDVDLALLCAVYDAADSMARRLEAAAAEIRRRSVRSALDFERRGTHDVASYVGDVVHTINTANGNLGTERLIRAAGEFGYELRRSAR